MHTSKHKRLNIKRHITDSGVIPFRPELLESLYSQVSHLDTVLTSLEGQIQVLEAVQRSLPRDVHGKSLVRTSTLTAPHPNNTSPRVIKDYTPGGRGPNDSGMTGR